MEMPGRTFVLGIGMGLMAKRKTRLSLFRIYNPALGRFLSVDPLKKEYPWYTPYQFAGNMPVWAIDLDGLEEQKATSIFKFIFGSPAGYSNPKTSLDHISNHRLKTQVTTIEKALLWAPYTIFEANGGDELYSQHSKWDKLGKYVQISRKSTNIVNVNSTKSAQVHNERIKSLDTQFHISQDLLGSETGLVNLLLGSY
jgi:hypothetical protein